MIIKQINYIEFFAEYLEHFKNDVLYDLFIFPSYLLDVLDYDKLTKRWDGKDELLQKISIKLEAYDEDWHKIHSSISEDEKVEYLKCTHIEKEQIFNFAFTPIFSTEPQYKEIEEYKDLRGLFIKDFHLNKSTSKLFDNAAFDYCIFDNCTFEKSTFLGTQFNCVWFQDTKFIDCNFYCNTSNSVFINCSFEKVDIKRFDFASFSNNLFIICDVEISPINVNPQEFAFIQCGKIKLQNHDYQDIGFEKAGLKVLNVLKQQLSKEKYKSISKDIYRDYKTYFIEMNKIYNENFTHDKFLKSYYAYKLFEDYSQKNYKTKIDYLFGRYVFAYGLKWQQPLIALFILIIISAPIFLFNGISFNNEHINRDFIFDFSELFSTIRDFGACLYISFCSILNIDINWGINNWVIDIFKSVLAFMGIILITIFTFNLVRKYIK